MSGRRPPRLQSSLRAALLLSVFVSSAAIAAGGSYATSGTGTFAQSLWWLNFSGFNTGSTAAQNLSFTLPNSAGTLSLAASVSSGMTLVAEPAWSGGGAFGHGAYNGLSGTPIFYWLNQSGTGTTTLASLSMKDASGNARSFALYAADGENTNSPETIVYGSSTAWSLIDTVNYYASYNGGVLTLTGTGSGSVTESAPSSNDNNYNASVVLGTSNPTQVSTSFSGNEAALFAVSLPPVTFNLSVAGRVSASDQFTVTLGYTSPAATVKTVTTTGTATTATTGAMSVIGTNSITLGVAMAAGSASALTAYTGSMSCSNSGPGTTVWGGTATVLPSGSNTAFTLTPQTGDAISCTLTLTPVSQTVSGTVYNDANHDSNYDAGDGSTGLSGLYVKLATYSGGSCQSPAKTAAAVSAVSGSYSVSGLAAGSYCLILSNNNTLSSVTAALPAGWIGTQNASGIIQLTALANELPGPQNFGLYNGSSVSGTVFGDTGAGSGTANNGSEDGSEAGLSGVVVQASGGSSASATSAGNGSYTLWIPAGSGSLILTPTAPANYLATGGSAGTSGGSYTRPSVTFTPAAGSIYTGVNFGLVPPNSLAPSGAQQAQPGATVTYAHTFIAGSGGQVTLSLAGSTTPATPAWTQVLYQDTSCSGTLSGSDPVVSAALTVTAGQKVCLLVKVSVPAGALAGAQSALTLSAAFQYTGATPVLSATASVGDVTTVGSSGTLVLSKLVSDVTQGTGTGTSVSAKPGDVVQYNLTATNSGSQSLATLVIYDSTPSFTTFVSTSCPATLPAGITACTVTSQPAAGASGALKWSFTGSLSSGATLTVTYQVKIGS